MNTKDHKTVLADITAARFGRRNFLKAAGIGAASATLSAAGLPLSAFAASAAKGQVRIASISYIDTLDPHFTGFMEAIKIHDNIYNGLLKVAYDGKVVSFVPDLAESWEMENDRTHLFKLRPNVVFHDGTPCNAEAVKWNLERVAKGQPKSPHNWKLKTLKSIAVIDPLTIRLTFETPYAFFPVAMTGSTGRAGTIVSPAAVEKWGKDFGRHPTGTGPFRFVSWREHDSIELERNPDYFVPGQPKLEKVSFMLMKEPSSAVAAMLGGQVDGMSTCPFQFLPRLKANPNIQVFGDIEGNYSFVGMNCRKAPFDDINLRRAVAYCIDRDSLIKQAYFGLGIPAYTPISPPMTAFYDKNIAQSGRGHYFDLDKAKAFRAQAKNQSEIEISYMIHEDGAYGTRVAQTVLPMLEKIGIKAKLDLVENAAWVHRRNSGDFEMFDFHWDADLDPDETLYPEFSTGSAWNFYGWSSKTFDENAGAAQTILDIEKRKELYKIAEDALIDEAPIAMTVHLPIFKIVSKKLKGFSYLPVDSMNLANVGIG